MIFPVLDLIKAQCGLERCCFPHALFDTGEVFLIEFGPVCEIQLLCGEGLLAIVKMMEVSIDSTVSSISGGGRVVELEELEEHCLDSSIAAAFRID